MRSFKMEKKDYSQLELFSHSADDNNLNKGLSKPFLKYILTYEKIILVAIGFVITGVIAFSLGVERGKQISVLRQDSTTIKTQSATPKTRVNQGPSQYQPVTQQESIIESAKIKDTVEQKYTIQLATYQSKTSAQKEAKVLKDRGQAPLLLSKSGYIILCVGNFSNKEKAKSLVSEFKKRYQDCYIRRL